ncbi:hypothetical protein ACFLW1_00430 [Chloroflexota bacterium]
MVKPRVNFTEALENVLAGVWQVREEHLDNAHIRKTREAVIDVRTIYRNKGEKLIGEKIKRYSQSIDFTRKRYRAGYIAAFGERHAYLTYRHLKKVEAVAPEIIPEPQTGDLTVTVIGAGAALELYGLCYFYNEKKSRIRKLRVNCIEKVNDWQSERNTFCDRVIKKAFPKLRVFPHDIDLNLINDNITLLSPHYDHLIKSDIILIYNILNEITSKYEKNVWKNLEYLFKICDKRVLVLLMEPAARYTLPRINPIVRKIEGYSKRILKADEEKFVFNSGPLKIKYEENDNGLNIRLFKKLTGGPKPTFEKALKRIHLATYIEPLSPITKYDAERQYRTKSIRHSDKTAVNDIGQPSFNDIDSSFGFQEVTTKYLTEQ